MRKHVGALGALGARPRSRPPGPAPQLRHGPVLRRAARATAAGAKAPATLIIADRSAASAGADIGAGPAAGGDTGEKGRSDDGAVWDELVRALLRFWDCGYV